jgi:hypothetical protein
MTKELFLEMVKTIDDSLEYFSFEKDGKTYVFDVEYEESTILDGDVKDQVQFGRIYELSDDCKPIEVFDFGVRQDEVIERCLCRDEYERKTFYDYEYSYENPKAYEIVDGEWREL